MEIYLDFYEPPTQSSVLGRCMDEIVMVQEAVATPERVHMMQQYLVYLPELAAKEADALRDHLVRCRLWRWFDDLAIYRTAGEPCLLFSVVEYEDEIPPEMRIHVWSAVRQLSGDEEAACELRVLERCQSLGLCA